MYPGWWSRITIDHCSRGFAWLAVLRAWPSTMVCPGFCSPEDIRSRIYRILQHSVAAPVDRRFPFDHVPGTLEARKGNLSAFFTEREEHLVYAPEFGKLVEHMTHCLLNATIRIQFHASIFGPTKANRDAALIFSAARLLPDRLPGSAAA